jgi:hypothetical protein
MMTMEMKMFPLRPFAALLVCVSTGPVPSFARPLLQQAGKFNVPEANQGVGGELGHFHPVDNCAVNKYDKRTGKLVKKGQRPRGRPM